MFIGKYLFHELLSKSDDNLFALLRYSLVHLLETGICGRTEILCLSCYKRVADT